MFASQHTPATLYCKKIEFNTSAAFQSPMSAPTACALCKKAASEDVKLRGCGGCGEVAYCSVDHQREDWKQHKLTCKQKHKAVNPLESHLRKGTASGKVWPPFA